MTSPVGKFVKAVLGGVAEFIVVGILAEGPTRWDRVLTIVTVVGCIGLITYLWITRGL
jgi:hypothetical protein